MKITNGFVWKVVNAEQAASIIDNNIMDVFILHDDTTETLIETNEEYRKALDDKSEFGIEVGHLALKEGQIIPEIEK